MFNLKEDEYYDAQGNVFKKTGGEPQLIGHISEPRFQQTQTPLNTNTGQMNGGALSNAVNQNALNQVNMANENINQLNQGQVEIDSAANTALNSMNNFNMARPTPPDVEKYQSRINELSPLLNKTVDEMYEEKGFDKSTLDPNNPMYDVDKAESEKKFEKSKTQKLGNQLQIAGAMFQELGNPKLYAGATSEAVGIVSDREDKRQEKIDEDFSESMAVAEAMYEGNVALAERLMDEFQIDLETINTQIQIFRDDYNMKSDEYKDLTTDYNNQITAFKENNQAEMDRFGIVLDKWNIRSDMGKDRLAAGANIQDAYNGVVDFNKALLNKDAEEYARMMEVSDEFTKMFKKPENPNYGKSYEEKLALARTMAGSSYAANVFVDSLPLSEAEYVLAESKNMTNHAQQLMTVGQKVFNMSPEQSGWFAAEQIFDTNLAPKINVNKQSMNNYSLSDDEAKAERARFTKYGNLSMELNSVMGDLQQNGDIASFKNRLATSQMGGVLALDLANFFGVENEAVQKLREFATGSQAYNKQVQLIAVKFIEEFTGEGSSRISEPEREIAFRMVNLLAENGDIFADPQLAMAFYSDLRDLADLRQAQSKQILDTGIIDSTLAKDIQGEERVIPEETTDPQTDVRRGATEQLVTITNDPTFTEAINSGNAEGISQILNTALQNPENDQETKNQLNLAIENLIRENAVKLGLNTEEEIQAYIAKVRG